MPNLVRLRPERPHHYAVVVTNQEEVYRRKDETQQKKSRESRRFDVNIALMKKKLRQIRSE
jgi:hypothetical protein